LPKSAQMATALVAEERGERFESIVGVLDPQVQAAIERDTASTDPVAQLESPAKATALPVRDISAMTELFESKPLTIDDPT